MLILEAKIVTSGENLVENARFRLWKFIWRNRQECPVRVSSECQKSAQKEQQECLRVLSRVEKSVTVSASVQQVYLARMSENVLKKSVQQACQAKVQQEWSRVFECQVSSKSV